MIGLLGGTFDPIHFGHLRPALELLEELSFAELRFLPAPRPALRNPPLATADERREMVARAIAGQPGFVLDDREYRRPGTSYMIDTLRDLRAELGGEVPLVLIMGMDAFRGLPGWRAWQQLTDHAHLLVTERPGVPRTLEGELASWLEGRVLESAQALQERPAGGVLFRRQRLLEISATDIRACIAEGRSARYLLPETVWDYIQERRLYRTTNESR
ncbi:MAG: nicotinate-nucleotide adenylyltransferase [Gammaproteobacteria bacterium]|nr:MAG: nicotinate-nucleotide adenylyltransferase [Gammaproteobacteria bacterium]